MPDDRTVLDSLLEGRNALVLEVQRLSVAIAELDGVIGQIGGGQQRLGVGSTELPTAVTPAVEVPVSPQVGQPVNPPVEVEPVRPRRPTRTRKATARKTTARPAARATGRARSRQGEAPKSIRVHVLEMLAAEDREFGLAEIIERVHDAGIQAHDDAVRSITIKLMKDGRVERVGRGQYRLTPRGARHAVGDGQAALSDDALAADANGDRASAADNSPAPVADDTSDTQPPPAAPTSQSTQPASPFTPPLNLGQPWERS